MSGHNKWSSIKHKKAKVDAQRGKIFSKINKAIMAAARTGGGNPDQNIELKNAILKAKEVNMPKENVERAIKKGTGELEGVSFENISYEGYAPAGVAVLIEALTDNRNRTTSEVRHAFTKYGGNLGANGCVKHLFERKGFIYVSSSGVNEDALFEAAVEAGAADVHKDGDVFEIKVSPDNYSEVKEKLEKKYKVESSELTMDAQMQVALSKEEAKKVMRLIDAFEESDDIQNVYSNADISEEILDELDN